MTRLRKRERRTSILRAARTILARRGFFGARAEDFAREARVSAGLLFRYFPSLRALQEAVVAKGLRSPRVVWPRNLSKAPPRNALKAIASTFTASFAKDPDLLPLSLFGALAGKTKSFEPYRREVRSAARRLALLIRTWARQGWTREIADADVLAWLLISALAHAVMAERVFALPKGSVTLDRTVNIFVALLEKGASAGGRDLSSARESGAVGTWPPARKSGRILSPSAWMRKG